MKQNKNHDQSILDRVVAVMIASVFFGTASVIAILLYQGSFTLSVGGIILRALPGIAFGTWLGIRYPQIAKVFGFISIG